MNAPGNRSNALVFIVDDEALLGQFADTVLTEAGYRTRCFVDPEEALRAVREDGHRPDLLVTDFVMGSMTGLDLIQECKRYHPNLRTVLLSGTVNESELKSQPVQPDHFMPKPYPVQAFLKIVNKIFGRA